MSAGSCAAAAVATLCIQRSLDLFHFPLLVPFGFLYSSISHSILSLDGTWADGIKCTLGMSFVYINEYLK